MINMKTPSDDILRIKCPFDGKIILVKNTPGIENKYITCPVCSKSFHFKEFKPVNAPRKSQDSEDTKYRFRGGGGMPEGGTKINPGNNTLGILTVAGTGKKYKLCLGRNVIGRKTPKSQATFQIDTGGERRMSREHLVIEVRLVPGKGYLHILSLYKEKVNDTFLGKEKMYFGDSFALKHGDIIRLPSASIIFEIPDDEYTEMTI